MSSSSLTVVCLAIMSAAVIAGEASAENALDETAALLAAEEPCGLHYDAGSVAAYIEKVLQADDAKFGTDIHNLTAYHKMELDDMSVSTKVAFCTQEGRVARTYGLTR